MFSSQIFGAVQEDIQGNLEQPLDYLEQKCLVNK